MAAKTGNTAHTSVTLLIGSERLVMQMDKNYFNQLLGYKSAMAQARCMLAAGIIAPEEYAKIDTIIAKKYGISSCSIYRENDFIKAAS
jgi:hypothetical protein